MSINSIVNKLKNVLPRENILSSREECYAYCFDSSSLISDIQIPKAVVFVETIKQVQDVVRIANKTNTPIICRGAGTNTVGACIPTSSCLILNFSKMNKILELNSQNMTCRVQPGVVLKDLQDYVEKFGLFYPPDPSNLKVSTIGGSIAQNSAGARCFKYGATKDYIIDMLVVTSDGNILRTGASTVKNAAGYNLGSLFIGSEGTLGIVVEATLKLIPKPQSNQVIMSYFSSVEDCINSVNEIINQKLLPSTIDFMDRNALQTVEQFYPTGLITDKETALIIEIDGLEESIAPQRKSICSILEKNNASSISYSTNDIESEKIWFARRSSMGACTKLKPHVTTDDVIVPRNNLAQLVIKTQQICNKYNLKVCLVGHVGDGSIHPQIPIDMNNEDEYHRYKLAKSEIYKLAVDLGGTISAEHGIGLEKKDFLPYVVNSEALKYMRDIKKLFDPKNILNPYKIF